MSTINNGPEGGMNLGSLAIALQQINIAIGLLNKTMGQVFPQTIGTATTATAGAATLPAQPAGFLDVVNPVTGATVKVPFYNP